MEIIEIEIDKIKPDSDNPRTVIEEEELKEMAQSIITEGIINPIEVDKDFMIITGERRWRAAKLAGFKTIPAKIMDLDKNQRFLRQVVENIQHNAMSDWDTANAFKKIIEAGWLKSSQPKSSPIPITRDHGVRWLSRKIGKSKDYITEKLDILEASGDFQQAVKCGEMAGSFTRVLRRTPSQFKDQIERKILDNEFKTREGALELVAALKREEENPVVTKKLLDVNYSTLKNTGDIRDSVTKISPRVSDLIAQSYEPSQIISKIREDLARWLKDNPKDGVSAMYTDQVIKNLNYLKAIIDEWFLGKEEVKFPEEILEN